MKTALPSCDTIVALGNSTAKKNTIFAKSSDRPMTESQPLLFVPAAEHPKGSKLKCTDLTIDQVEKTNAIVGSRPWFTWGVELGVNDHGVAIGNEATFPNISVEVTNGLNGMDLVRLGLERGNTAHEAMHVIIDLLEKYGQGAICFFNAKTTEEYQNMFILADQKEAWKLETVERHWVAKKVKNFDSLSNIYTIESDYDECSDGLEKYAIAHGVHTQGTPFNFAKSFIDFRLPDIGGYPRYKRSQKLLGQNQGKLTVEHFQSILRDHYEGEIIEPRWDPTAVCNVSICMHSVPPLPGASVASACHTAGSGVVELHESKHEELIFTYWGSMCAPCSTFFIPFYNTNYKAPKDLLKGSENYSDDSFWWRVHRMCLDIEENYAKYIGFLHDVRTPMEKDFREKAAINEAKAERLLDMGNKEEAAVLLNHFSDECVTRVRTAVSEITEKIENDLKKHPGEVYRKDYLAQLRKDVAMPL
ncbi:MAG: C69 family dipeptidase [Oscillospiraceae bacterium]|jgi:dipeptidase|nr:C69 family dipeptidase [Oscillospiraceae bacterium]